MDARAFVSVICIGFAGIPSLVLSQAQNNRRTAIQTNSSAGNPRLPFMAKFETTQVRTLPDGSTSSQETTEVIAVDAQGRRMTATTENPQPGSEPRTRFTIYDPVAHTNISYTSPGAEATVSAIPLGGDYGCSYAVASIEGPTIKTTSEDLGTAMIQGVEARGRRSSKNDFVGKQRRNPILLNVVEYWKAVDPGLQGLLVRYMNDDRSLRVKTTKELVSFSQSDPAPIIFRLPSGYRIHNREVSPPDCPNPGDIEPLPPPAR